MNFEEIDRQVDEWILESKTKIKDSIEEKTQLIRFLHLYRMGLMLINPEEWRKYSKWEERRRQELRLP